MSRFSHFSLDCAGAMVSVSEQNEPSQTVFRVVTDAYDCFKPNRTIGTAWGTVSRHHVVSEHQDQESAMAACRQFCTVYRTDAWVERECSWGDEYASEEETETLCHLTFDEDSGQVVDA